MRSAKPFLLMQDRVRVSDSIGIAMSPPIEFSDLLRLTDVAMYRARARRRTGGEIDASLWVGGSNGEPVRGLAQPRLRHGGFPAGEGEPSSVHSKLARLNSRLT